MLQEFQILSFMNFFNDYEFNNYCVKLKKIVAKEHELTSSQSVTIHHESASTWIQQIEFKNTIM